MTPETRETLEQAMDYCTARANSETMRPGANALDLSEWDDEDIVEWVESLARWGRRALALRDVLTPRTCSGCRWVRYPEHEPYCAHESEAHPLHWCQPVGNADTFGCTYWEPREGEGGAR